MTSSRELRVGVIGLGEHFREILLPALISQNNIILNAFCDRNSEKRAWAIKRFPNAVVTDLASAIDFWAAVDCVVCCSYPEVHERVLALAIDHSVHCFVEKPAASKVGALDYLIDKNNQQNREKPIIRVGRVFRYVGGAARFIEIASQQTLHCLEITYIGSGPRGSRWDMSPRVSFALTHLTHAVDFVTAVAGRVISVKQVVWLGDVHKDSVAVTFETERCRLVTLTATNAANAFTCKATAVTANGGTIHLDNLRTVTFTGDVSQEKRSGEVWKERDLGTHVQNDGYFDELRDFFAEIRGEGACRLPDLAHARHVL